MPDSRLNSSWLLLVVIFWSSFIVVAQKKPITSATYDEWNRLDNIQQTASGDWITYEVNPLEGDGVLNIESYSGSTKSSFNRGKRAVFHCGGIYMAFLIKPPRDTIRRLKLDKVKKIKFPKDTLAIYWTGLDSVAKYPDITSFKMAVEGDWMAYLSTMDLRPESKRKKKKKKKGIEQTKTSGKTLFLYNPISHQQKKLHRVKQYEINRRGTMLAFITSKKGKKDSFSIHVIDLSDFSRKMLIEDQLSVEKMKFDYGGQQLLFMSSMDTGEIKNFSLSYWRVGDHNSRILVDSTTKGMPDGWTVSKHYRSHFSRDGKKIFLGTNELERNDPKDTLLATEKASVDIWSGHDLRIQPEQLKRLKRDQMTSYAAVFHISDRKFVQLANKEMAFLRTYNFKNASFGLGLDNRNYSRERNWTFPWKFDYYKVNIDNGKKELIKSGLAFGRSISPSGKYFIWYNPLDSSWVSTDLISKNDINLTNSIGLKFASDNNGQPSNASPEGAQGWTKIGNDEYYSVRDYYDIWFLHPSNTKKSFCLTHGQGKRDQVKYSLQRTEFDSIYLSFDKVLVKGVDDLTKSESLHEINNENGDYVLSKLIDTPHKITYFRKAKKSDKVLMRRMSFTTYPDIESGNLKLDSLRKVTTVNPQQTDYIWGTVEFVAWKAYDSTALRGLLYKPEDFDSTKLYPMIVYFYEMYQNNFHYYYSPKPTASTIHPTEYVSNGYIVFIPDIHYEVGHPGKSAFNCIVSGTDHLIRKYSWIDSSRLGLQGQSWGGYQTAQLITMTNKYRAAMAGAPVSNMFSAYGGIRWGSGLSRMFQYERTQSRIGSTIWERPDLYIENSPIFHLPNVTTPLLIMHNDHDGSVPWYQGIELYMGLRRLDKSVWMLNYNDDHHNLTRLPNKRDLSIRMRQFFDYYLLNATIPPWMKNGLPAIDKGIEQGY